MIDNDPIGPKVPSQQIGYQVHNMMKIALNSKWMLSLFNCQTIEVGITFVSMFNCWVANGYNLSVYV